MDVIKARTPPKRMLTLRMRTASVAALVFIARPPAIG